MRARIPKPGLTEGFCTQTLAALPLSVTFRDDVLRLLDDERTEESRDQRVGKLCKQHLWVALVLAETERTGDALCVDRARFLAGSLVQQQARRANSPGLRRGMLDDEWACTVHVVHSAPRDRSA